jgi:hypothetical protein
MEDDDKLLVWLHGEIKTPPFTQEARIEAGVLIRQLQQGENLELPIQDQCQVLGHTATNCGFGMRIRIGGLSTELMTMQS